MHRLHLGLIFLSTLGLPLQAQQPDPPDPDIRGMIQEPLDHVANGIVASGSETLRYRMRGDIYLPEKLFSNSIFAIREGNDSGVGFFEAWVSMDHRNRY